MRTDKTTSSSLAILTILVLVPGSYMMPGLGQGMPHKVAPTSSQRLDSAPAGCFEVDRYSEDFETGWASNWYLGPGFQIFNPGGGNVLLGGGTSAALATYLRGDYWTDFSFAFKMRLISGDAWVSLRYNSDGVEDLVYDRIRPTVTQRYFVGFNSGSAYLVRQDSGTMRLLGGAATSFDPNQWYAIGIVAFSDLRGKACPTKTTSLP